MQVIPPDGYSGPEYAKKIGASYRQVDYWCRTDLINCAERGSGSYRVFTEQDVRRGRFIVALLKAGVKLEMVRDLMDHVDEYQLLENDHDCLYLDPIDGKVAAFPLEGTLVGIFINRAAWEHE